MKKLFLVGIVLIASSLFAQNIQLHYDFGEDREYFTTTIDMFKPDDMGSTFFFVDFDYNDNVDEVDDHRQSSSSAYWELVRMFNTPVENLTAGVQYNDGLNTFGGFGNVFFVGVGYPLDLGFITLNTSLWLRDKENQDLNFQVTVVWFKPLLDGQLIFTGFFDLWGQDNADFDADGTDSQFVILTEPQLWYNLTDKIAIGTEIELSSNFLFGEGSDFIVNPTAAVKWTL